LGKDWMQSVTAKDAVGVQVKLDNLRILFSVGPYGYESLKAFSISFQDTIDVTPSTAMAGKEWG
jgi:hypothetical protein